MKYLFLLLLFVGCNASQENSNPNPPIDSTGCEDLIVLPDSILTDTIIEAVNIHVDSTVINGSVVLTLRVEEAVTVFDNFVINNDAQVFVEKIDCE